MMHPNATRTTTHPTRIALNARAARLVIGLLVAAVGLVGAVRTFDPVALSAAQVTFLVMTVLGVALTELHLRD